MGINGKILVFVDLPGGELDETGRGLLSYGARLAGTLDASWGVAVAAAPDSGQLAAFGAYGTPTITCMAAGESLLDTPALLGKSLAALAQDEAATVIILPHNDLGSTLAPVVAHELDAAIMTELVTVRQSADGVRLSRRALGVRIAETRMWDGSTSAGGHGSAARTEPGAHGHGTSQLTRCSNLALRPLRSPARRQPLPAGFRPTRRPST